MLKVATLLVVLLGSSLSAASAAFASSVVEGRGDVNGDGLVNAQDVALLGQCPSQPYCLPAKGDLNGDDQVNFIDANILQAMVKIPPRYRAEMAVDSTRIYNYSSASDFHCRQLAVLAYKSLGPMANRTNIRKNDFLFCGNYYIAWIDNTGFAGELNGLWALNAEAGESLNFIGNPRNLVIVAERRDGRFPTGYTGGTHIEITGHNSEIYSIDDAGQYKRNKIPWWRGCNKRSAGFGKLWTPLAIGAPPGASAVALKLTYESKLTKEGDFANHSCPDAHLDYKFPDTFRRPLYLRTGWELYGDRSTIVRTLQARNPVGNPFPGVGDLPYAVHSFVITSLASPVEDKNFRDWVRPAVTVNDNCRQSTFPGAQFTYNGGPYLCDFDNVVNYLERPANVPTPADGTPMIISRVPLAEFRKTLIFYDPAGIDVGFCDCTTHGGVEVASGQLRDLSRLQGGAMTAEARFVLVIL